MRFGLICVLLLLAGAAEGQKKKTKPSVITEIKPQSIGHVNCTVGSSYPFTGPIKGWLEEDCEPTEPTSPPDPSKMTPEAIQANLLKRMGEVMKCLLRKMGAMAKDGTPIRPKTVASLSSLFAGASKKVATAKTTVNKCFDQTGDSLKTDKQWAMLSVCILAFLEKSCLSKEQLDELKKSQQAHTTAKSY